MTVAPISLGSGSNKSRFGHGGAARHINCYIENQGENAKAGTIVFASDGLDAFATMPESACRAVLEVEEYLYAVYGATVYRVDSTGATTALGSVSATGPVYMVQNRRDHPHIGIVSGGEFYVYDTADGTYTHVTGPADFIPTSIAVLDGYGILPVGNSIWYVTELDDFKTIDGLAFAKAESNPDETARTATREGEVVLFGKRSIEWWQDTGGADFAFTRSQAIEIGCLAGGSVANVDRTLIWIAHDGTVRLMAGYDGKRISNHDVERSISITDPTEISATSWWNRGHTFYCISANAWTWVYDLTTGEWHERKSLNSNRWRIAHVARFGIALVACDATSDQLYYMDAEAYDEAGEELIMTVQTPPSHAFPHRLAFNALFVDVVPGVGSGTTEAENVEPELMVKWSDNGGHTWSNERRVSIGRQGDYSRRAAIRRLGVSTVHGRTFHLSLSAKVAKALIGASVDVTKLEV